MERVLVSARPRLQRCRRDAVLEDAQVTGFVVADFLDARVRVVGVACVGKVGCREGLDALLVEGVDDPFRHKQVLEQEVVGTWCAVLGRRDGLGKVGREGAGNVAVIAVDRALARDGSGFWIGDVGGCGSARVCRVSLGKRY